MSERDGKRMAVFGMSGSGKSYFVKNMIRDMDRVVVFDPEEEYGELPGFQEINDYQQLLEVLYDCWDGSFRVAYVPPDGNEQHALHEVSSLIERMQRPYKDGKLDKRTTLVVDELNLSFPQPYKPEYDAFARLCSRGRKRGINIIGVAQRPAEIATRFRGNLPRLACFSLSLPNDIDWVIKATGRPEIAQNIRDLGEHCHVLCEVGQDLRVVGPT